MTDISVIICTFNRCVYLPGLLNSLRNQMLSKDSFEILVVDNNSTDETRDVIRLFQIEMPNLRYVFESNQGLSLARNRGLSETHAPFVIYIDDDAYAEDQWLVSVLEAFALDHRIVCVGGPVKLDWQGPRPTWIPTRYESLFTSVYHGQEKKYLTPKDYLVGANIAFKREWLLKQGGFPMNLGRKGLCLLSGEEAAVYHNIFLSGNKAFYHPEAKVIHHVTEERKSKKWFFRRLFWDGATQSVLDAESECPGTMYARKIYRDLTRCIRFLLEALWAAVRIDRVGIIDAICRLDQRVGRLYMHMSLSMGKMI
jgi:glycosyltransferase involved in cell wall biosynthesis